MFAELAPLVAADGLDTEMRLRIPSDLTRIERVVELVATHLEARFSCHETIRLNVRVALAEALANAIQYGNRRDPAREVRLRLAWGSHRIEAEVTDEGDGFDPSAVPDPTAPDRLEREDGRGLYLIRQLMDDVRFNAKGNSVWMTLRRA